MEIKLLLTFSLIIPIAGILVLSLVRGQLRARVHFLFVLGIAAATCIPAIRVLTGNPVGLQIKELALFGNLTIRVDSLSAWFILIINLTCITGALYGIGYMESYIKERSAVLLHWILFLLFQTSMLWVCMVQNALAFLIVWELMSLSSFLLVIFDHANKKVLQAGINYLVQMHIGVVFLTIAFIWVYFTEGSFSFTAIQSFFQTHSNLFLFFLFFVGFGIKAGFIPLHTWLPQAHPAAPSHVSGVMSGVIVKLGIYGILRIILLMNRDYITIGVVVLSISILTGLYGILNAAVHRDFKRMLAYCTIENIGIIGSGTGLGLMGLGSHNPLLITLGFGAALLHTLNHSLFKSLLFFSAGSVYLQTHTRDIEKLGGLLRKMPQTAILFLIGALSIGGLPPFNGFVSEFLLYGGLLVGIKAFALSHIILMIFSLAGLALIGGLSMLTFTKTFGTMFLGSPRTKQVVHANEVSLLMRLPQYFIVAIILSIGLFPQYYFGMVNQVLKDSFPQAAVGIDTAALAWIKSISTTGIYSLVFICICGLFYFIRQQLVSKRKVELKKTWGCGYVMPDVRMQYSGKSFSKSLGKLLGIVLAEKKKYNEISSSEIFPVVRKHSSYYTDFFGTVIINRIVDRLNYSMNYFRFIQNGQTQLYIFYGLFFIIIIFLGTLFNFI
jgi:hydrogenase-4 component B